MKHLRLILATCLVLLSAPLRAQEWGSYATISAEPTTGRICTGDANGKDIICASPSPYVDASGKVGFGNTSPAERLDVSGNIKLSGYLAMNGTMALMGSETTDSGAPSADGAAMFYDNNAFGTAFDGLVFEKTDFNNPVPDGGIMFANRGSDGIRYPSLSIRGSGNVGIGTASPTQKLEVAGNIKLAGYIQPSDTAGSCSVAADKGKFRYNTTTGKFQICR